MGKFVSLSKDILAIFGLPSWVSENIKSYPGNFVGVSPGDTYIRIHVLPQGAGLNLKSASGQVIIDVFTPAGNGPMAALQIADRLDAYLVGKSIQTGTNATQLGNSSFTHIGADKSNPSLFRSQYSIPFNYFGV